MSELWRGLPLGVHRQGSGRRLGYLHGLVAAPQDQPFIEALCAERFAVLAPGLPGFSGTAPCADIRNIHDWVFALSEIIDIAEMTGAPCVATSVGAMLALELAAVRPEAFSELILISPLGLWRDDLPVADPFATTLSFQRAMLTSNALATAAFFDGSSTTESSVAVEENVQRYGARAAAASLVWPIPEFGLSERIHRVTCPVTLIWGAQDQINPPEYMSMYADVLVNLVGTHLIKDSGHLAEWDQPTQIVKIISDILSDQKGK